MPVRVQTEDFDAGSEIEHAMGAAAAVGAVVSFTGVVRVGPDLRLRLAAAAASEITGPAIAAAIPKLMAGAEFTTEFKNLEFFYFHNCIYEGVWKDNRRRAAERPVGRGPRHRHRHLERRRQHCRRAR